MPILISIYFELKVKFELHSLSISTNVIHLVSSAETLDERWSVPFSSRRPPQTKRIWRMIAVSTTEDTQIFLHLKCYSQTSSLRGLRPSQQSSRAKRWQWGPCEGYKICQDTIQEEIEFLRPHFFTEVALMCSTLLASAESDMTTHLRPICQLGDNCAGQQDPYSIRTIYCVLFWIWKRNWKRNVFEATLPRSESGGELLYEVASTTGLSPRTLQKHLIEGRDKQVKK